MRFRNRPLLLAVLLFFIVVLPLGVIEGWYGRTDYSGDAIPYLDMARAIHDGHWNLAFNPLWGLGYPLLIAAIKPVFAPTAAGEWDAVHLLNLIIYAAAFASFIFLLNSICRTLAFSSQDDVHDLTSSRLDLAGTALFLSAELCLDTVSRVGPDTLVTTLVLFALGLVLRLRDRPRPSIAITLGLVLGFGYVVKTIFLPLSLVIVLVALYGLFRRRKRTPFHPELLVWTVLMAAVVALPYALGLSWAFGRPTLGESGSLNYAWHVNRLELMHWQGGPAQFGKPLHPTTQLLADPPIYSFAEPFHVSYPPFFNPPYYYEGYRHFFNAKLQLRAIAANLLHLYQALHVLPITFAVLFCVLLIFVTGNRGQFVTSRGEWLRNILGLWPVLLPSFAGVALYLQVHLEGRYLPAFLLVLATVPIAMFLQRAEGWPPYVSPLVLTALVVGSIATIAVANRSTIEAASHNVYYSDMPPWVLARFLEQHGLKPGDPVAIVGGPATHCTWAYVDRLRIVSELSADVYAPPDAGKDMFWNATPEARQQMLDLFAHAGAKLVVAPVGPSVLPGWTPVPGTAIVVHDLVPAS